MEKIDGSVAEFGFPQVYWCQSVADDSYPLTYQPHTSFTRNMSGNNSGAQKSAKERLEELRQQVADVEDAAWMEEEALRAQEAEWKHLADLEKVRQAKIQIQQAEQRRCQEIVQEMISFRFVLLSFP